MAKKKEDLGAVVIPVHPGRVLQMMLDESGISQSRLAKHLRESHVKINEICRGRRGVSTEMAKKLARAFSQSPGFWLNLQKNWELSQTGDYDDIEPLRLSA